MKATRTYLVAWKDLLPFADAVLGTGLPANRYGPAIPDLICRRVRVVVAEDGQARVEAEHEELAA